MELGQLKAAMVVVWSAAQDAHFLALIANTLVRVAHNPLEAPLAQQDTALAEAIATEPLDLEGPILAVMALVVVAATTEAVPAALKAQGAAAATQAHLQRRSPIPKACAKETA